MQVARLVEQRHERSLRRKLRQMVRAWQLEAQFSKTEILNLYLRLAPFGGNIEGARAATLAYFGKEQNACRLAKQRCSSPCHSHLKPASGSLRKTCQTCAQSGLRSCTRCQGDFGGGSCACQSRESSNTTQGVPIVGAASCRARGCALSSSQPAPNHIAARKQQALQTLLSEQTRLLGDKLSSAVLAIENRTGKVVAYVGASDYLDGSRRGSIDMVQAVRSPGSTLKPIIYGLGFDSGLIHPETLIEDRRVRFGAYSPENFDDRFHGAVTIREALGLSLNIRAVKLLNAVGPVKFVDRLKAFDVMAKLPDQARPSLAVALGGVGMRMVDLVTVYSALARGGVPVTIDWQVKTTKQAAKPGLKKNVSTRGKRTHLLSPIASWYVTDILLDAPVPLNAKAGRIALQNRNVLWLPRRLGCWL